MSAPHALQALLFVIQPTLNITAATYLDAVTYQIAQQLKILPTALFSVILLDRRLSLTQWLSLPCMAMGVAVVSVANNIGHLLQVTARSTAAAAAKSLT